MGKGGVEGTSLTADERRAVQELYDRGALDLSRSHDLAGIAESGAARDPTRQRAMKIISFLFHHAERFNREVTALASYRLARESGIAHDAAVDKASDLTWQTHFDYSAASRPRPMQHPVARIALQFRNFQINMYYRLIRDAHEALKGETPQVRKEARFQLAGVLGMMALMAGTMGVPLLQQIVIPLYGLFFGDPNDEKSAKEEFRDNVLTALGPQLGGIALDGVAGYLTGTSLTQRIGFPDLWFQSDDRVQDARDWMEGLSNQILGPDWNILVNMFRGFQIIHDGKGVERGIEYMVPKVIKDQLKAYRYATEGALSLRGDPMVASSDLAMTDALKQSLGFTPAVLAEQYERNDEKVNMLKRVETQRRALMNDFAAAWRSGDRDAEAAALERVHAFNDVPVHRAKRITNQDLRDSIRTRQRLTNRAQNGIIIQNRRFNEDLNSQMPPRVY